jgi:hypothetical protein
LFQTLKNDMGAKFALESARFNVSLTLCAWRLFLYIEKIVPPIMTGYPQRFQANPQGQKMSSPYTLSTTQLYALLRPETDLERHLLSLSAIQQGLLWGEPRFGHPEGRIAFHVREVLDNIARIEGLSKKMRQQLRLIALVHDTFKYAEPRTRPRQWDRHHAVLARQFLEPYTADIAVLDVVETHDDAYYAWLAEKNPTFKAENPHKTLEHLRRRVGHCLQLYYLFFKCDTQTGDKVQAPLLWFEQNMRGIIPTVVREGIW